ncbi:NUDIX hydrolase [Rhizobium leguminosarum]|uniref:NUDIX hydrolase n=1 Tax=Rhizobium leguminosarum TaxID=384 RepID=UPI001AE971A6|nr:NUDIX hydrolase [Rhizobium leguminosarum]MBP2444261.1 8-oxo-dGTP pyrophosphatase MutT (NUDIX family) [Rhizobium leguminosarum]
MFQDDETARNVDQGSLEEIPQAGAICFRRNGRGEVKVLLVASRRTGRWGLPKGHVESSETSKSTAEREAFEEAGVKGALSPEVFGSFTYFKDNPSCRYEVSVHLLEVRSISREFPEKDVRKTKWFRLQEAIEQAGPPGLKVLLRCFELEARARRNSNPLCSSAAI